MREILRKNFEYIYYSWLYIRNTGASCNKFRWKIYMKKREEGGKIGSCEVAGAISEGTRRTSGAASRYSDPRWEPNAKITLLFNIDSWVT